MNTKLHHIQNWEELAKQAKWSVSNLAKLCGVSTETLRQHSKSYMGKSTQAWMAENRQQQAIQLIRDGTSIKETAYHVGYQQQTNFTRQFKTHWGFCPSQKPWSRTNLIENLRK
jgi:AraC-like DNA-binding protein